MIATLEPYSEYKDSGVPWLGEIPAQWDVRRMKLLLREVDSRSSTGKEQLLRVSQYTGVTQRKSIDGSDAPDTRASSLVGYKRVTTDDLVINIMLAWNGSMGVSRYEGIASPAYCVYRFKSGARPWYYHELLRLPLYKGRIKTASTGVVESRLRLYSDDLGRIEALQPPPEEQDAIVRFLDYANWRLERAIRAKRRVIALLHEQKQAIIHRAVTGGLYPTVPLKPSGIPWIGDIPKHWEVRQLGRFVTLQRGFDITKDQQEAGSIPVVSSGGVASFHSKPTAPGPGVILGRKGSVGTVHFVDGPYWAHDTILWVKDFGGNHPRFVYYVLSLLDLKRFDTGSANPTLNRNVVHPELVAFAPLDEQVAITLYLDQAVNKTEQTIMRLEREISLLREYRTRLVADVVTGKLDVRPAACQLPAEPVAPEPAPGPEDLADEAELEPNNAE